MQNSSKISKFPQDNLEADDPLVAGVRQATPYIHAHRGRTFVIAFGGEAVADTNFSILIHDLALLHGLGIRLVLVHGARPQIEARLAQRGIALQYVNDLRITDDQTLACVKEAVGVVRLEIEALLSLGLANSPMAGVRIPVVSGNALIARPLGVLEGVDYGHTGTVRRVEAQTLKSLLDLGTIVLLPPLGYAPTGEIFNLSAVDVACSAAIAMQADKLIFLVENHQCLTSRQIAPHLLAHEVNKFLIDNFNLPDELKSYLRTGAKVCQHGVRRVHLIARKNTSALLRELLTREGNGTLITEEPFEDLRPARNDDVPGILNLLRPLEASRVLVRRSREHLESEIDHFMLLERDGFTVGCAALYEYPQEKMAELACLVVHPDYRGERRGERLLEHLEKIARTHQIKSIFVLTTQTAHWFQERGFQAAELNDLPLKKQILYNFRRNSKMLIKNL